MDELGSLFSSLENMGREVQRSVSLGSHTLTLRSVSTQQEVEAYQQASEESRGVPSLEEPGNKVGPEYILLLKLRVLVNAISEIDGVPIDPVSEVLDSRGEKRETRNYLLSILRSWPSEVIAFLFMEYNLLQVDLSKQYDFTMTHRAIMSSMDQLLKLHASLSSESSRRGEDTLSDKDEEDLVSSAEGGTEEGSAAGSP